MRHKIICVENRSAKHMVGPTAGSMSYRRMIVYFGALLVVSLLEIRVIRLLHEPHFAHHAEASRLVLEGRPEWKAYQNRLAVPVLVKGIATLTGLTWQHSHFLVCCGLMFMANAVAFFASRRFGLPPRTALIVAAGNAGLFVSMQHGFYLYSWDYADHVVFLLFVFAILLDAPLVSFAVLYIVELLNREAAIFIAIWLIASSAWRLFSPGLHPGTVRRHVIRLTTGVVMLGVAFGWTTFIRGQLYRDGDAKTLPANTLAEQHIHLSDNFYHMLNPLKPDSMIVWIVLIGLAVVLRDACRSLGRQLGPIMLLIIAMLLANFVFGMASETRIWITLIPFLVLLPAWGAAMRLQALSTAHMTPDTPQD